MFQRTLQIFFLLSPLLILLIWISFFYCQHKYFVLRTDFNSQLQYLVDNQLYENGYHKLKTYEKKTQEINLDSLMKMVLVTYYMDQYRNSLKESIHYDSKLQKLDVNNIFYKKSLKQRLELFPHSKFTPYLLCNYWKLLEKNQASINEFTSYFKKANNVRKKWIFLDLKCKKKLEHFYIKE